MSRTSELVSVTSPDIDPKLLERYGCGPIRFSGTAEGLYDRHLLFDDVVDPAEAGPREKFEAVARSVKDVLSQRWVRTEQTYKRANPKRVYYISMEFLIGRSLANNVTNLLLDPVVEGSRREEEPRLARLARTGAGRGPRQRRARAPGGVLSRLDGDDAAAGHGLRPALRIRHLPAVARERLAARTAGQLAAIPRSVGGRASQRASRGQAQLRCSSCAAGACARFPAGHPR